MRCSVSEADGQPVEPARIPLAARNAATDPFAAGFPAFEDYLDACFGPSPRQKRRRTLSPSPASLTTAPEDAQQTSFEAVLRMV